jgi:hypothetical protein
MKPLCFSNSARISSVPSVGVVARPMKFFWPGRRWRPCHADLELGDGLVARHVVAVHGERLDLVLVAQRGAVEALGNFGAVAEQQLGVRTLERLDDPRARDFTKARRDAEGCATGRRQLREDAALHHLLDDRRAR